MKTIVLLVLIFLGTTGLRVSGGDEQKPFDLTTLLGETLQHCRIIKATPEGITVSHDKGVSKIPFENLNDEWKKMFHYSPEKSREFQKEEAARRALAEETRRRMQRENDIQQIRRMNELAAAENQPWRRLEEAVAQEQVIAAVIAAAAVISQPGLQFPLPGDPTPYLGGGTTMAGTSGVGGAGTTVRPTTEVIVPASTPLGQVYTPGATGSQRYIIDQGAIFTTGDGTIQYVNPGYIFPPIVVCPPRVVRPISPPPAIRTVPTNTTIRIGPP